MHDGELLRSVQHYNKLYTKMILNRHHYTEREIQSVLMFSLNCINFDSVSRRPLIQKAFMYTFLNVNKHG